MMKVLGAEISLDLIVSIIGNNDCRRIFISSVTTD